MPSSTSTTHARTALIIGGGIAGPVAAAALARAGIESHVAEAHSEADPEAGDGIGGSLALAPNGLAALEIIGAAAPVRERALPVIRSTMTLADRPLGDAPRLTDQEPQQMIARGALHGVLRNAASAAGVTTSHGRRLVAVEEHPDGVTARFADGSSRTADVLIGADGVRSTVRRLIDPAAPDAGYTGMLGFEGYVRDVAVPAAKGEMVFAFGRRAYYLYWPTTDGGVAWGANLPTATYRSLTDARRTSAEEWLASLRRTYAGDTPGARLAAATAPADLQVTGALHVMPPVPHWYRNRLVLVGDAVHAPSNSTGQGASLAIESAIELARCLRDAPIPEAFGRYERRRRERVETITARGVKLNRAKTPGPLLRPLLRVAMPIMLRRMDLDTTLGAEQRYRIDWESTG